MEGFGGKWKIWRSLVVIMWSFGVAAVFVSAERSLKKQGSNFIPNAADESETNLLKAANFLWQSNESGGVGIVNMSRKIQRHEYMWVLRTSAKLKISLGQIRIAEIKVFELVQDCLSLRLGRT